MIIVIGKGVIWRIEAFPALKISSASENSRWAYLQQPDKNLFTLFIHMLTLINRKSPDFTSRRFNFQVQL